MALNADALCTLDEVKQYLNIDSTDPDHDTDDAVLERLINAASEYLKRESQREFIPLSTQPEARTFPVSYWDALLGKIRVGDVREVDDVTVYGPDGTTYAFYTETLLLPYGQPPYQAIRIPYGQYLVTGGYAVVNGTWGWADSIAGVPEDIRQAVILTVGTWYARDVEDFSATFSIDQSHIVVPRAVPSTARDIVESYRIYRVA